jgi:hypothetical protein
MYLPQFFKRLQEVPDQGRLMKEMALELEPTILKWFPVVVERKSAYIVEHLLPDVLEAYK